MSMLYHTQKKSHVMFHLIINCLHCFLKSAFQAVSVESYLLLFIFLNLSYCIAKSYIYIYLNLK